MIFPEQRFLKCCVVATVGTDQQCLRPLHGLFSLCLSVLAFYRRGCPFVCLSEASKGVVDSFYVSLMSLQVGLFHCLVCLYEASTWGVVPLSVILRHLRRGCLFPVYLMSLQEGLFYYLSIWDLYSQGGCPFVYPSEAFTGEVLVFGDF